MLVLIFVLKIDRKPIKKEKRKEHTQTYIYMTAVEVMQLIEHDD